MKGRRITKLAEEAFAPLIHLVLPPAKPGIVGGPRPVEPRGPAPEESEGLLYAFKYRAYLAVLVIGTLAALISWWMGHAAREADVINGVTNPALALFCMLLVAILLWRRERAIHLVERVGYAGIVTYFVADKYYVVYSGDLRSLPVDSISEVFSWTPVIYILAYLIFGAGKGLAFSVAFYLALQLAGIPHMLRSLAGEGQPGSFNAFVQFYLANVVILVLLYVFARLIAAYLKTHALNEASQKLAHTDFVTGVPNRRHLYTVLEWEISEAPEEGRVLAVIMFDLDHFKSVNDDFGHDAGDRVLEGVAQLVSANLRAPDQLSRWGGEEFLVLAPGADLEDGRTTAQRLRKLVEVTSFDGPGSVTASFGVAAFREGDSPESLLKRADEALYRAKAAGRNRVEVSP